MKNLIDTVLTTLVVIICALGIVIKLWVWTDTKLDKGWNSSYISHSISESKEMGAYICRYETISGDLSYPSESLYIPPIKEAFTEWQYYRHRNTDSDKDPYWYELKNNATEIIIIFNDSIRKAQSVDDWYIRNFAGSFPCYFKCFQPKEIPDTIALELYYRDRNHTDSIIEVPMGTIKLRRMDSDTLSSEKISSRFPE